MSKGIYKLERVNYTVPLLQALEQTWGNLNYVNCCENILACMTCLNQFEEADEHIMKLCKSSLRLINKSAADGFDHILVNLRKMKV